MIKQRLQAILITAVLTLALTILGATAFLSILVGFLAGIAWLFISDRTKGVEVTAHEIIEERTLVPKGVITFQEFAAAVASLDSKTQRVIADNLRVGFIDGCVHRKGLRIKDLQAIYSLESLPIPNRELTMEVCDFCGYYDEPTGAHNCPKCNSILKVTTDNYLSSVYSTVRKELQLCIRKADGNLLYSYQDDPHR